VPLTEPGSGPAGHSSNTHASQQGKTGSMNGHFHYIGMQSTQSCIAHHALTQSYIYNIKTATDRRLIRQHLHPSNPVKMKAITRITSHYNRTLFLASGMIFLSSVNYDEFDF
jgi:hypothetical protein